MNLADQNGQLTPLAVQLRDAPPDATRSQPLVKTFGVRVRLNYSADDNE
jgi:hypothetical protein